MTTKSRYTGTASRIRVAIMPFKSEDNPLVQLSLADSPSYSEPKEAVGTRASLIGTKLWTDLRGNRIQFHI